MSIKNINVTTNESMPFTYKGYVATISYDRNSNVFQGKVEGVISDLSFEDNTVDGLDKKFKETIDEYLQWCEENGREPEEQFTGEIKIQTHPELLARMFLLCNEMGMSVDRFIENAMINATNNLGQMVWNTRLIEGTEEGVCEIPAFEADEYEFPLFYKGYGAVMYYNEDDEIPYNGFLLKQKPHGIAYYFNGKTEEEAIANFKQCVDDIVMKNEFKGSIEVPFDGNIVIKTDSRIQYVLSLLAYFLEMEEDELLEDVISRFIQTEYDGYGLYEPEVLESMIVPKNDESENPCE